jgi:Na+/H+ antiporter NhaA
MKILKQEISDKIWLIFSPIGIIITLIEYFLNYIDFSHLILYVLSIVITIIISIIIYYSKFVGEADSKALITLSFLDPINLNKNTIHPFNSIIVLMNNLLAFLIVPIFLFIYNLYSFIIWMKDLLKNKRFPILFNHNFLKDKNINNFIVFKRFFNIC